MDQRPRRIQFLRSRIETLTAQKQRLLALASAKELSKEARELWAARLDITLAKLRKHQDELEQLGSSDRW